MLPTQVSLGFPGGSADKESACNARDLGSIPGLGRAPGEGKGYPLQYPSLENSMDYTVCGVTKSWIRLSDFHFHWCISGKESTCQYRVGLIPWLGGGQGNPLQFSCLENPHLQRTLAGCSPLGRKRVGHE